MFPNSPIWKIRLFCLLTFMLFCNMAGAQSLMWVKKISNNLNNIDYRHAHPIQINNSSDIFLNYMTQTYDQPTVFVFGDSLRKGRSNNELTHGIVRLDTGGNKVWHMYFSQDSSSSPIVKTLTDGKNIYLLISVNGKGPNIYFQGSVVDSLRNTDKRTIDAFYILKINLLGDVVWKRKIYAPNKLGIKAVKAAYNPDENTLQTFFEFHDSLYLQKDEYTYFKLRDPNRNYAHCTYQKDSSRFMMSNFDTAGRLINHRLFPTNIQGNEPQLGAYFFRSERNNLMWLNAMCKDISFDNTTIDSGTTVFFKTDSTGGSDVKFRLNSKFGNYQNQLNISEGGDYASIFRSSRNQITDTTKIGLLFKDSVYALFEVADLALLTKQFKLIRKRRLFQIASSPIYFYMQDLYLKGNHIYIQANVKNSTGNKQTLEIDGFDIVIPARHNSDYSGYTGEITLIMKLDTNLNVLWLKYLSNKYNKDLSRASFTSNIEIDKYHGLYFAAGLNQKDSFEFFNTRLKLNDSNYYYLAKLENNSISRGNISPGPYCAGDSLTIPFTSVGRFFSGNRFIAHLSDENGSFANPSKVKVLGSVFARKDSFIKAVFPKGNFISSNRYRIRILSTNPPIYSYYRVDTLRLRIYSRDTAYAGEDVAICRGDTVPLFVSGGSSWEWTPKKYLNSPHIYNPISVPDSSIRYTVVIKDQYGCGIADTAYKFIRVYNSLSIDFTPEAAHKICLNSEILISAAFKGGDSLKYKWIWTIKDSRNNYFFPKSDSFRLSDTIKFQLPAQEKDSIQIMVYLHDACSQNPINSTHTLYVRKEKSVALLPLKDSAICPGSASEIAVSFKGAEADKLSWKWQMRNASNQWITVKTMSGKHSDTLRYRTDTNWMSNTLFRIVLSDLCSNLNDTAFYTLKPLNPLDLKLNTGDSILCNGSKYIWRASGSGGNPASYTYRWTDVDSGNTLSLTDSLVLRPERLHNIRIELNDNCSAKKATLFLKVDILPALSVEILHKDSVICYGQMPLFKAKSIGGIPAAYRFQWLIDQQLTASSDSFHLNPKAYSETDAKYRTLSLVLNDLCSQPADTASVTLLILPAIRASVAVEDSICFKKQAVFTASAAGGIGNIQFKWSDVNNVGLAIGDTLFENFNTPQTLIRKLIAFDACSVNDTIVSSAVFLPPLKLDLYKSDTCNGQSLKLYARAGGGKTSAHSINWFKNMALAGSGSMLEIAPNSRDTYMAVLNDYCSSVSDTAFISANGHIKPKLQASRFCFGDETEIKSNLNDKEYVYQWIVNNRIETSQDSVLKKTFPSIGKHDVQLRVSAFQTCPGIDSLQIYILANPVADFSFVHFDGNAAGIPFKFLNHSQNATEWFWHFGNNDTSVQKEPEYRYTDSGRAKVTLIASNQGKCFDTIVMVIPVYEKIAFYFPNVFSPNGNGKNERFGIIPEQIDFIQQYELQIFNRWGELVFYTNNPSELWNGDNCMQGIYMYKSEIRDIYNVLHDIKGVVELLR